MKKVKSGDLKLVTYLCFGILFGSAIAWVLIDVFAAATVIVIAAAVALNALITVPSYHFGVVERFGNRTGRVVREGLHTRVPFFDKVKLVSMELTTLVIGGERGGPGVSKAGGIEFTTRDKVHLICEGSLQYRADPDIADENGRNVFVTMTTETISEGLKDAVEAKLGALGGDYASDDFIKNRHAIADILNATLRLKVPPHANHIPMDKDTVDSEGRVVPATCGLKKCASVDTTTGKGIRATSLILFYNKHFRAVKGMLDAEKGQRENTSVTERRYGIDIETFALATIRFTEETQKSLEKDRQATARQMAFDKKIEMAKKVIELGAAPQVALNAADVSLDSDVKKTIVSVEGDAGVLGGLLSTLPGKGGEKK